MKLNAVDVIVAVLTNDWVEMNLEPSQRRT